jgi:hypothetical protein
MNHANAAARSDKAEQRGNRRRSIASNEGDRGPRWGAACVEERAQAFGDVSDLAPRDPAILEFDRGPRGLASQGACGKFLERTFQGLRPKPWRDRLKGDPRRVAALRAGKSILSAPASQPIAGVAVDDLAGDEARIVRCEKQAQRGDILSRAVQLQELLSVDPRMLL